MIRITTWNAKDGVFSHLEKRQTVIRLIASHCREAVPHLLLFQQAEAVHSDRETRTLMEFYGLSYTYCQSPPYTDGLQRLSTLGVLIPDPLISLGFNPAQLEFCVGRSHSSLSLHSSILSVTGIHAYGTRTDAVDAVKQAACLASETRRPWILTGDMGSFPNDYESSSYLMAHCGTMTFQPPASLTGCEWDFFLHSPDLHALSCQSVDCNSSSHNPVTAVWDALPQFQVKKQMR